MDGTEMPHEQDLSAEETSQTPILDETTFIKTAERRSIRRARAISLRVALAVVVVLALAWVGWRAAIYYQGRRINDYFPILVRNMKPNNEVNPGVVQVDFPGATIRFSAYRRVGTSLVPAGEIVGRFYPWGDESFQYPEYLSDMSDGRLLLEPGTTTELLFLEPPVGGGDAQDVWEANPENGAFLMTFATARNTSIKQLRVAPASATVEAAVSFSDVKTLREVETCIGDDVQLAWGAVRVGSAGEMTDEEGVHEAGSDWWPQFPGSGVMGIPFPVADGAAEGPVQTEHETGQVNEFAHLAERANGRWGKNLREQSDYLTANGVSYYGAVVIGSPAAVLELAENPEVSTITVGAIVMPWE